MKNSDDRFGFENKHRDQKFLASPQHVLGLTKLCGWTPKMTPRLLSAACGLLDSRFDHSTLLVKTETFFRGHTMIVPQGLETIPPCWLHMLPSIFWNTRKSHWHVLPYWMTDCRFEEGVLAMRFEQQELRQDDELGAWDHLRVTVNISLFPNLWTPLTKRYEQGIWIKHPELRKELLTLP